MWRRIFSSEYLKLKHPARLNRSRAVVAPLALEMADTIEHSPPPSKKLCLEKEDEQECESRNDDDGKTSSQGVAEPVAPPTEVAVPFVRIKRRKFALLLSYNGKGYKGMQW